MLLDVGVAYQVLTRGLMPGSRSTLDRARIPCIVTDTESSDTKLLILGEHICGPGMRFSWC